MRLLTQQHFAAQHTQHGTRHPMLTAPLHSPIAACKHSRTHSNYLQHKYRHSRGIQRVQCSAAVQQQVDTVDVTVEKAPKNSRRLFASVEIQAPVEVVWQALTDYEGLSEFIPGLTENQCLERRPNGARLLQVGAQDVALGVKFSARVVLDIFEFIAGAPTGLCSMEHDEHKFPQPRGSGNVTPSDIAFSMVEGDFQAFQGVWRMERTGIDSCKLSYALFVRPQVWLPVRLIQGRIKGEVETNVKAVRRHAERLYSSSVSTSSSEA